MSWCPPSEMAAAPCDIHVWGLGYRFHVDVVVLFVFSFSFGVIDGDDLKRVEMDCIMNCVIVQKGGPVFLTFLDIFKVHSVFFTIYKFIG
jgi:hypothetical protein